MPDDDETLDPATGLPAVPPAVPPVVPPAVPPAAPPAAPPAPPVQTSAQRKAAEDATASDIRKREKKKLLVAEYGTDDEEEVARIKEQRRAESEEARTLKAKDEEAKRAQMGEVERLTADVTRLTSENEQLKLKIKNLEQDQVASKQDAKIRSLAVKHIKPNKLKYAIIDFGEYIRSLTKADAAKIDELRTENWFKKFARENPDMALGAAPPAAAAAVDTADLDDEGNPKPKPGTPPAVQRPTRVVPAGKPKPAPAPPKPAVPDPLAGKTPRPGFPNSMNKKELSIHMQRQGLRPL